MIAAVIGGDTVHKPDYLYVLISSGLVASVMLVIALLVNNMSPNRHYPKIWI